MRESTTLPLPPEVGPDRGWEASYPGRTDQVRHVRAAPRDGTSGPRCGTRAETAGTAIWLGRPGTRMGCTCYSGWPASAA